jgi:hypothetical protein
MDIAGVFGLPYITVTLGDKGEAENGQGKILGQKGELRRAGSPAIRLEHNLLDLQIQRLKLRRGICVEAP